jgi:hypothetical protein
MSARNDVRSAKLAGDLAAEAAAHLAVDVVKRKLGERGSVWWTDGTADLNRHLVKNTPYAAWFSGLRRTARRKDSPERQSSNASRPTSGPHDVTGSPSDPGAMMSFKPDKAEKSGKHKTPTGVKARTTIPMPRCPVFYSREPEPPGATETPPPTSEQSPPEEGTQKGRSRFLGQGRLTGEDTP